MRLLLDTHVSLAAGGATSRLPQRAIDLLLDEANALYVSAISAWEIASKHRLGKLPPIHRDLFDRMLICQARVEGLTVVTSDDLVRQYDVPTLW